MTPSQVRPTRAEIDLDALQTNFRRLKSRAQRATIMAVVKADAYGHGLVPVAKALTEAGARGFCVALMEEGVTLREAGIDTPILVLNGVYAEAHAELLAAQLTPVIYETEDIVAFNRVSPDKPFDFHLHVDSGMNRLGVQPSEVTPLLNTLPTAARLTGLMTHFAAAEADASQTHAQMTTLLEVRDRIIAHGIDAPICHAANSAALLNLEVSCLDWVRPGIALYGICPPCPNPPALKPVMRIVSNIARIREIPAGQSVGYNNTWTAPRDTRIATLAIGYGDGLMWHLSNRGEVLVHGRRCPIVGRVSMDLTGVDVTDCPTCARGDEAIILGKSGDEEITASEIAARADTIPYEVLTAISQRVPRTYTSTPARPTTESPNT